jgi:hypothetical protein
MGSYYYYYYYYYYYICVVAGSIPDGVIGIFH